MTQRMAANALSRLPPGSGVYCGVDLEKLRTAVNAYFSGTQVEPVTIELALPGTS